MTLQSNHPNKSEMLKALKDGTVPFKHHLESCFMCREQFALFSKIMKPSTVPLKLPGNDALQRYRNVPLLGREQNPGQPVSGAILFDSWRDVAHVDVRDVTFGHVRRLCMGIGKLSLELVAERRKDGWAFVAKVYSDQKISSQFVLKVGSKKMLPNSGGYYQWRSTRAPRKVLLQSMKHSFLFDELIWS